MEYQGKQLEQRRAQYRFLAKQAGLSIAEMNTRVFAILDEAGADRVPHAIFAAAKMVHKQAMERRRLQVAERAYAENRHNVHKEGTCPKCKGSGVYLMAGGEGVCFCCKGKGFLDAEDAERNNSYWSYH